MTMNADHFHTHDNFKIAGKIIDQVSALKQRNAELKADLATAKLHKQNAENALRETEEACLALTNELAALKESHRKEVEKLRMEISGLKKSVEVANKVIKQKGGFTIKDIKFGGVKLEGMKCTTQSRK